MTRIAVLDDNLRLAHGLADWSPLAKCCDVAFMDRHIAGAEAPAALADFDIICTLRERLAFPRELIERLPKLRYLCVTGKRYDTVDIAAAAEHGIVVSNTPVEGIGGGAVTELTWALILGLVRHVVHENRVMRDGGWQTRAGTTLRGKRLGVVGLGGIGADVARIGIAFGMKIVAWSPNLTPERAEAHGVRAVDKATLFACSDIVTLHLALSDRTRNTVSAAELSSMKSTACLVNTARAGLIDEPALIQALGRGAIAGAALDVFEIEPLPSDHVLQTLDNVLLTPHLGYVTREMLSTYYRFAVENIVAYLNGAPIRVVTPQP